MIQNTMQVRVKLWGIHVGTLRWDRDAGKATFSYSEEFLDSPYDISPTLYPKASKRLLTFFGSKAAEGLPEFLADSLPDDWGNVLYDRWTTRHHIPTNEFRTLSKLSFIGSRAMGALEFEPSLDEDSSPGEKVAVDELYDQALKVLEDRIDVRLSSRDEVTLAQLIRLGTSVGGKHAKGLIAMSPDGQVRSGQVELPPEFKYYILKFKEDAAVPTSEVEKIFFDMATECGIDHFLTERFDRKPGGEKLHMQTLHALAPGADDYTTLFWLCDKLRVPDGRKERLFRQMVFNYFAGVSDDHSRNFSFLMDRRGEWDLSPAYDLTFTANIWADASAYSHCLGVWRKYSHLTREDFVSYGDDLGLEDCGRVVDEIAGTVSTFPQRCREYGIDGPWPERIWKAVREFLPPPAAAVRVAGPGDGAERAISQKYAGKEIRFADTVILAADGVESGRLIHFTVDGKKKTCVTDARTGDICISPGHIRQDELEMGIWKTVDGKPAACVSTRVLSLKEINRLGSE